MYVSLVVNNYLIYVAFMTVSFFGLFSLLGLFKWSCVLKGILPKSKPTCASGNKSKKSKASSKSGTDIKKSSSVLSKNKKAKKRETKHSTKKQKHRVHAAEVEVEESIVDRIGTILSNIFQENQMNDCQDSDTDADVVDQNVEENCLEESASCSSVDSADSQCDIKLTASPTIIDVNLTHTMTMQCAMAGNAVSHLVSIVITRVDSTGKEEIIASVSTFDQALPATDLTNIKVNGTVSENVVTANFLSLEWDHPTEIQAKKYSCEINAIDSHSRPVRFTQSINVTSREATTSDIVNHIRVLEKTNEKQIEQISTLEALVKSLTDRLTVLETKNGVVG